MALMWRGEDGDWLFLASPVDGAALAQFANAEYVGHESEWDSHLAIAVEQVQDTLSSAFRACPDDTLTRLYLEVGHEYKKRSDSPSGSSQYADYSSGQPLRGPRDPLTQVWPTLRRYVTGF